MKNFSRLALALLAAAALAVPLHARAIPLMLPIIAVIPPPIVPPPIIPPPIIPPPTITTTVTSSNPQLFPGSYQFGNSANDLGALMIISGGGTVTTGTFLGISTLNGVATINVAGGGLLAVGTDLLIGNLSDGTLTIDNGGTVTVGNQLRFGGFSRSLAFNAGTLTLNAGGTLAVGGTDGLFVFVNNVLIPTSFS